jgi:Bifunctional DNA primase/polymerase, N-terminal/Primase C terminal 1 (PriCT-1)
MTQSPTLAAALALASINVHVFPCKVRAKEPATPHGFQDATVDPERITHWWHVEPHFNVAAATGKTSGLVILDIDGPDGEAALRTLEAQHGELPATWETITPRGRHIGFEYPDRPVRSSVGRIATGIDVRADGGYVLCPPSLHPCGRRYEWSVDCADTIAAAPGWLIDLATEPANGIVAATPPEEWCDLIAAGVSKGARNCTIARLAGHLLRKHVDPFIVLEILQVWNASRCTPPLPAASVEKIVGSIASRELKRRGDA